MPPESKPELRVPGWFVAVFFGAQGALQAAIELLPPGPYWQAAKILYAGVIAAGIAVAMRSSGAKR